MKKVDNGWGVAYKGLGVRKAPDNFIGDDDEKMEVRVRKRAFNILMVRHRERERVDDTDLIKSGRKSPFLSDF